MSDIPVSQITSHLVAPSRVLKVPNNYSKLEYMRSVVTDFETTTSAYLVVFSLDARIIERLSSCSIHIKMDNIRNMSAIVRMLDRQLALEFLIPDDIRYIYLVDADMFCDKSSHRLRRHLLSERKGIDTYFIVNKYKDYDLI